MNEPTMTVFGNLADDPELRFTPSGAAVCKFRLAHSTRTKNADGSYGDGEPIWMSVTVWRQPAENIAESLRRGDRVVVTGRFKTRTYEDKEGIKRTAFEIEADEVGASLTFATVKVQKKAREGGGTGGGDDWSSASKSRPANADQQRAAQQAAPAAAAPSADW